MARIYANENFPLPVVLELRRLGHDVLTTHEAGKSNQAITDEEVLEYACTEDRMILTLNRKHFIRLHSIAANHSGILVCTFDPDFIAQAERIHKAIESQLMAGQLIRINRPA
jgi:hypothetical protein